MAQIRKYQPGGKTPNKIGVLTIDGKEYTGDGFIQHMRDYRKTLDDKVADQFGNIINALEAGENLQYDSDSDVLTGNVDWNVSKLQEKRLDKGEDRTKIGKIFGGLNEGKEQRVRYAINALRGMGTYEEPKEEVKGKSIDWSKDINLVYSKDKNGKRTFSKLDNTNAVDRLKQFATLIGSDWTDNDTFTGYNGFTRDQYMTAYTDLTDAISAVENGTWNENTLKVLQDFGIFDKGGASTSSKTGNVNTSANNGDGSDTTNIYFTTDSNGNLNATTALNTLYPGNAIFNDFWEKSSGYRDEYKGLKGYVKFDNKLYKISDLSNTNSTIHKYLQNNGFFNLTNADQYAEANKKINFLWDSPLEFEIYDPTQFYHPALATWSKDDQYRYRPLTGVFEYTGGNYTNPEIIQYWDKNTERDVYGLPKTYKYAILTDKGLIDVNESDLKRINGGEQKGLSTFPIIQDEGAYQGYYEVIATDKFNNPIYTAYIHATDNNAPVIFNYRDFDRKTSSPLYNKNIKIDRNIWNILNNKRFFTNLSDVKNGYYQTHFTNAFEDAVGSGIRDLFNRELEVEDWEELGFTHEDAQTLYNYFNNLGSGGSRFTRQQNRLVDRYVPKKQSGGLIGTSKAPEINTNKNQIDIVTKDLSKPANYEDSRLSEADWAEIVSLGADLGALVSGLYTGGGNPLAAGLGVTGTLTSFGAGVTRDGLDWGDAGNLVLGLGLDVASLFPGLGLGSTATKVVKSVKKVGRTLNTLLMGVGALDAAKGVKNIIDGKGSINDYRSLMNGLLVLNKVVPDLKLLKNTTFKGKTITKGDVKNASALKKEFVDGIIAKGKQNGVDLTHYNGARNSWIDDQGKIDYDEAYKALKDSKYINEWGLTSWFRDLRGKINEGVASIADNTIHGSWNPFSKNYRFNIDNRVLKPEVLAEPYKYKRVIADYGLDNIPQENWPRDVANNKYIIPTQTLRGTKIMTPKLTDQKLDLNKARRDEFKGFYKHGGVIKGEEGLTFDPRTGMWESNGTPIVLAEEFDNAPRTSLFLLAQNSIKTPGVTQTPKGAGEAPPKWRQNLKDYASRAFNYENLNTLGQVIGAIAANHKVAKIKEDTLKSIPLSRNVFQASAPAYYENTRGFDVRRDVLLNTQLPQTADTKLSAQWKRNVASELDKINREKYDYLSQNRNQYNQFIDQIENKNRELRVAESNAFMDKLSQRNMALAENTAGMIANDFKTFEQLSKQQLASYKKDVEEFNSINAGINWSRKMMYWTAKAEEWAKTNPAKDGDYRDNLTRYLTANPLAYDAYIEDKDLKLRSSYHPSTVFSPRFAKGGKLSAQDHIKINKHKSQDRILENKYQSIDKAVQKLNDNVIKIFLNMMK